MVRKISSKGPENCENGAKSSNNYSEGLQPAPPPPKNPEVKGEVVSAPAATYWEGN
jgi:hypothetical protein